MKYRKRKSENGLQWFVESPYENKYKIEFVCYSEKRADEYISIQLAIASAENSVRS